MAPFRAGPGWVTYTKVTPPTGVVSRGRSTRSPCRSRTWRPSSRNERLAEPAATARARGRRRRGGGRSRQRRRCSSNAVARAATTARAGTVPFYGDHQAGIVTPQQHHLRFASFDLTADEHAEVRDLLGTWTAAAARSRRGDTAPSTGGEFAPPDDTGEAGGLRPSRLTLTFGFGPGLFDDRYGLAAKRPAELIDLPRFEQRPARSRRVGRRPLRPGLRRRPAGRVPRDPQPHPHRARRSSRCGGSRRASSRRPTAAAARRAT